MNKILLYDVDSIIPNIALMKISTYFKAKNYSVDFIKGNSKKINIDYSNYTKGYASAIFTKNKNLLGTFPFKSGGTGISLTTILPSFIEHLMPDYSLYPNNNYSIGFTTRGCTRKCKFCFVPLKEGNIHFNANIQEFHNQSLPKIMLLDNNIFAYKNYNSIFEQLRLINKPATFKQGLDFRLLNKNKLDNLLSIKYDKEYIFAYDNPNDKLIIESQMNKYKSYFKDWSLKFFVLVGFNSALKEDIYRINYLKLNKCLPYIMRHENCYNSPYKDFYTDIAAYCNQVFVFKKLTFEEFLYKRYDIKDYSNIDRIYYSLDLWDKNKTK